MADEAHLEMIEDTLKHHNKILESMLSSIKAQQNVMDQLVSRCTSLNTRLQLLSSSSSLSRASDLIKSGFNFEHDEPPMHLDGYAEGILVNMDLNFPKMSSSNSPMSPQVAVENQQKTVAHLNQQNLIVDNQSELTNLTNLTTKNLDGIFHHCGRSALKSFRKSETEEASTDIDAEEIVVPSDFNSELEEATKKIDELKMHMVIHCPLILVRCFNFGLKLELKFEVPSRQPSKRNQTVGLTEIQEPTFDQLIKARLQLYGIFALTFLVKFHAYLNDFSFHVMHFVLPIDLDKFPRVGIGEFHVFKRKTESAIHIFVIMPDQVLPYQPHIISALQRFSTIPQTQLHIHPVTNMYLELLYPTNIHVQQERGIIFLWDDKWPPPNRYKMGLRLLLMDHKLGLDIMECPCNQLGEEQLGSIVLKVCWEKFANYFAVQLKEVKLRKMYYVMDLVKPVDIVDENTIRVAAILGSTLNGEFENALVLKQELDKIWRSNILSKDIWVPLVAFSLKDNSRHIEFEFSEMRRRFGWIVPGYTMLEDAQHVTMLRVVIREDVSRTLAERLVLDIVKVLYELDALPHKLKCITNGIFAWDPGIDNNSCMNLEDKLFDAGSNIWRSKGEEQVVAKKEFIDILKKLEGELGEKPYFGGENFGFVDIIAIPLTTFFYAYEKFGDFKVEEECPKITTWIKRCMERETVASVLPDPERVYEFVIMLRKMHGIE